MAVKSKFGGGEFNPEWMPKVCTAIPSLDYRSVQLSRISMKSPLHLRPLHPHLLPV